MMFSGETPFWKHFELTGPNSWHIFVYRQMLGAAVSASRQVQFDGPEKAFIFHPLFASENFAEDKVAIWEAVPFHKKCISSNQFFPIVVFLLRI